MNSLQICRDHYREDVVQIDYAKGGELSLSSFTETRLATFARRWLVAQDESMAIETKYASLVDTDQNQCRKLKPKETVYAAVISR